MAWPKQNQCSNCLFWDELKEPKAHGFCRANPPTPFGMLKKEKVRMVSMWAQTPGTDWCGQWVPENYRDASAIVTPDKVKLVQ